jgi:multiple antibiotic resistance protein
LIYMNFASTLGITVATVIALFPITNPIGTGIALNPYLQKLNRCDSRSLAFRIAMYTFFLLMTVMLIGKYILMVFGLSLAVVELAGGILVIRAGWNLLNAPDEQDDSKSNAGYSLENLENKIFYPLTFPITTGAGVIAAVLGLAAKYSSDSVSSEIWVMVAITAGLLINSLSIFIFYSWKLPSMPYSKLLHRCGRKLCNSDQDGRFMQDAIQKPEERESPEDISFFKSLTKATRSVWLI